MFRYEDFKHVELSDAGTLIPRLTSSNVNSCELLFSNLYAWGHACGTVWQEYNGHLYFYLSSIGRAAFADCKDDAENPSPDELAEVLSVLRLHDPKAEFFQVRGEYIDAHPDIAEHFAALPLEDDAAEYIYTVKSLVELSGPKLRKKRNLIRQFMAQFPDSRVEPVAPGKVLKDCLALAEEWAAAQDEPEAEPLLMEKDALSRLSDGLSEMGCEGVAVYAGDRLAAFSVYARINGEMFTESFEKSRMDCKGAAQFVNHEMAKRLEGRCLYINREQDLGSAGLRHAKLSYDPVFLLKNFRLVPR